MDEYIRATVAVGVSGDSLLLDLRALVPLHSVPPQDQAPLTKESIMEASRELFEGEGDRGSLYQSVWCVDEMAWIGREVGVEIERPIWLDAGEISRESEFHANYSISMLLED